MSDAIGTSGPESGATLDAPDYGSIVARISREIVGVHAQFYGRGPTRSKTIYREGIVTCVLGEIFTRAEQTLIGAGEFQQVRRNREAFQDTVEPVLRQLVEEITGRPTVGFLSQIDRAGHAAEVFVLAPPASEQ